MIGATVLVLGTIYGYIWHWSPIIWGLIGLVAGFFLGLIIELAFNKKKLKLASSRKSEVAMQLTCPLSIQNQLLGILKSRKANGVVVMPEQRE